MTSKLKCPFCGEELAGTITCPYCRNEKCEMCDEMLPRELLYLLDSTRKDLEIARNALEEISSHYQDDIGKPTFVNWYFTAKKMCDCADKALEQIEHKE